MRKFLLKFLLIVVPLALLMLNYAGYEKSGGDLNRIGKVSVPADYRKIFEGTYPETKLYREYSFCDAAALREFDVLTVGDSFSQQGISGYQNLLARTSGLDIVNLDGYAYHLENPLQLLNTMSKGDFFSVVKPRYVVLEIIERRISWYGQSIDRNDSVDFADFEARYRRDRAIVESGETTLGLDYFSDILKYFAFNALYNLDSRAFFSQVYNVRLTSDLFSVYPRRLLFFDEDILNVRFGDYRYVKVLNDDLNLIHDRLAERGVSLIVMPTPDKSDLYGEFMEPGTLPKERFFKSLEEMDKRYMYINTKALLLPYLRAGLKDVYYADDTHWSPIGAVIAADGLRAAVSGASD